MTFQIASGGLPITPVVVENGTNASLSCPSSVNTVAATLDIASTNGFVKVYIRVRTLSAPGGAGVVPQIKIGGTQYSFLPITGTGTGGGLIELASADGSTWYFLAQNQTYPSDTEYRTEPAGATISPLQAEINIQNNGASGVNCDVSWSIVKINLR